MHPAERTAHLSPSELTALRRKKNADAQAAFRKRRANYIATLEETVNNLEQVVRSLQETIQESKMTEHELKTENSRLKFELDSLRKGQQNGQAPAATSQRLDSAHWNAGAAGYRAPSESTPLHHYSNTGSVTPSVTPPLSATTSPSPPASSAISTSTSTSLNTSYPPSALPTPTAFPTDEGPMNMLCRPVQRSVPDVKPQFSAGVGENMYAFQSRPQDAGGWVDSPVDSQSVVSHGNTYVVGDQTRSIYSGNVQRYSAEAMTPGPLPLSVSIDDQRRRNSAGTSPTTTDPGSPLAFSPRGPPAMYVASQQQQQLQGIDAGAAFRSYFSHATGAGAVQPPAGPSSTYAASQADDGDMKDDFDDYERGGDLPLSDTLAVLKAHAFGGVRKPRTRNSRGREDRD